MKDSKLTHFKEHFHEYLLKSNNPAPYENNHVKI